MISERKKRKREEDLEDQFWEESIWNETYFGETEEEAETKEEKLKIHPIDKIEPFSWESLKDERLYLKLSDPYQREKYIRSMSEQIRNSSAEVDKLSYEYNVVTAALKDMDELEALPEGEKIRVEACARKIILLEKETAEYEKKKNRMTEEQYYKMQQYEESAPKIFEDMKKAEDYRELVCDDLKRLDNEKAAYDYRSGELTQSISNDKGMVMISLMSMALLYVILFIMQFFFRMNVTIGYLLTTIAGAATATFLYMKYIDERGELLHVENRKNRIILLQNTVKIRYINNLNLLDYLYLKYNVKSSGQWKKHFALYEEEKNSREKNEKNEDEINCVQSELLRILRCYQLSDARIWLHRPLALYDHKEMVEIRHEHIVRRQKLRAQLDYNRRLIKEGEKALNEFQKEYPQYREELLHMKDKYRN